MRALLPLLTILYELELAVYCENIGYHLIAKQRIHIFKWSLLSNYILAAISRALPRAERRAYFNYSQSIYAYLMVF